MFLAVAVLAGCGGVVAAQETSAITSQKADSSMPSSLVQVPYGQVSKQALTYSVSTVYNKDVVNNSVFHPGNSLFGKLPGLTVLQRTGEPGNDGPAFYLRGRSTTKTTAPLFLVDGFERNIGDVQLEDIESISVLKDAAATVMYGIRGANGVVLITSRRGKTGKVRVAGQVEQLLMAPTREPEFRSSADFVQLYNQALVNDGLAPLYSPDQIEGYKAGDPYFYPNVDWRREATADYATGTRANVNVSGGDKFAAYYVSLGYYQQGGLYKNTDQNEGYSTNIGFDNFLFRSNLDLNVNNNWTFRLDLAGRVNQKNAPVVATNTIWDQLYKYPSHLFPVYVQDNVYGGSSIYPDNPIGQINSRGYRQTNNRALLSTLSTKYDFNKVVKGLTGGLTYTFDNYYYNEEGYTKNFAVVELLGRDAAGQPVLSQAVGTNTNLKTLSASGYPYNDEQSKRTAFEGNLQYQTSLGSGHALNAQIVYHQDRLILGSESPYNFLHLSSRVNYNWLNRYFVEIGASYSGNEKFPEHERFGFFPAVSAAWVLSEEPFLKGDPTVSFLKLHASAGKVGNSSVGERFSYLSQYISGPGYNFGNSNAGQSGLQPGTVANKDFTWETAYKYDAGVTATFLKNLDFGLTYFFQKREDILVDANGFTPAIIGADLPSVNAGITHNTGVEALLYYKKQLKGWGYHAGFNASYVTDKIKYIPETAQPYDYLYRTGHPINQPFMLEAIGFFESDADIQNSPVQTFGAVKPGDIKYKDQNGDNVIDIYDEVPLKRTALPNWDMGLDLGFNIKGFSLTAFFQGQMGRSLYLGNEPILFWPLINNNGRMATYARQFWTEETKHTADYPRLTTQENKNNYRESSFWYVNGDFFRLRSLELGYSLPPSWIQKAKLSRARVFLRGQNLWTVDHLNYTDPEVLSGYPVMKSYSAGINVNF